MQLAGFMRKKKLKFQLANNGLEAVEKWKTGNFDLILPFTATGASPYRSSVIIVAQTASSLNSDRVKALAAGCNDFLTKPVNHHWLNNKVTEWGSIKALQMWADMPPPGGHNGPGPAVHAKEVADRLHVPEHGLSRRASVKTKAKAEVEGDGGAGKDKEGVGSALGSAVLVSSTSSAFPSSGMPSPPTFWGTLGIPDPATREAGAEAPEGRNADAYPDSPTPNEENTKSSGAATDDVPQDAAPPSDIPVR
ncbi:hypothetical protein MVEN_02421800 [Mycena venus]|uniref:Response regulatory domain-containing protein n=1 Tax=Mycena venus TaxID=2733690 RepID=A0A8H6WYJ4_9AGAR|nr:hypothetical protein MVEN_02421800 [Mycena venus]